jgi:lipopolysaccharide export system permease protein
MKIIDRYLIRLTLARFFMLLGLVLFALLMERLVRLLDLLATKNTPLDLVVRMMINLVPHYLSLALSAAFFISVLMAVIRLREDSELDAIYAGGISLFRVTLPIMGLALAFCALAALVIGTLQPHARYGYRHLFHLAGYGNWYNVLDSGAFLTGLGDLTMLVGEISADGNQLRQVFVNEQSKDGRLSTTTAETGRFDTNEADKLVLTLENATQVVSGVDGRDPLVVRVKQFSREIDTYFTPPPFRPRGKDEREMTMTELWAAERAPPEGVTPAEIAAEFHTRLVRIVSILVFPLLAVAIGALAPKRGQGVSLGLGLFLLIAYNEVLQFGESLIQDGHIAPWIGQELPLLIFALFSLWAFHRASRQMAASPMTPLVRLADLVVGAFRALARQWPGRRLRSG